MKCSHPDDAPGQDLAFLILDFNQHRVLPGGAGARVSDDTLDIQRGSNDLASLMRRQGIDVKPTLARRADYGASENLLPAMRAFPGLTRHPHQSLPDGRVATLLQRETLNLAFFPPEFDIAAHLRARRHRQATGLQISDETAGFLELHT